MANWNTLKTAVADVINANGNQAITGQLLQNVLNNIITNVGENAAFAGIATLDTNPGAPDGPVFYLTATAGTYPNFNGIEVQDGEAAILLWNNNVWTKKVTGFATQEKLSQLGSKINIFPLCDLYSKALKNENVLSKESDFWKTYYKVSASKGDVFRYCNTKDYEKNVILGEGYTYYYITDKNGNLIQKLDSDGSLHEINISIELQDDCFVSVCFNIYSDVRLMTNNLSAQNILEGYSDLENNIGAEYYEEFSIEKDYVANNIVRYKGLLYEFKENKQRGEWDSSKTKRFILSSINPDFTKSIAPIMGTLKNNGDINLCNSGWATLYRIFVKEGSVIYYNKKSKGYKLSTGFIYLSVDSFEGERLYEVDGSSGEVFNIRYMVPKDGFVSLCYHPGIGDEISVQTSNQERLLEISNMLSLVDYENIIFTEEQAVETDSGWVSYNKVKVNKGDAVVYTKGSDSVNFLGLNYLYLLIVDDEGNILYSVDASSKYFDVFYIMPTEGYVSMCFFPDDEYIKMRIYSYSYNLYYIKHLIDRARKEIDNVDKEIVSATEKIKTINEELRKVRYNEMFGALKSDGVVTANSYWKTSKCKLKKGDTIHYIKSNESVLSVGYSYYIITNAKGKEVTRKDSIGTSEDLPFTFEYEMTEDGFAFLCFSDVDELSIETNNSVNESILGTIELQGLNNENLLDVTTSGFLGFYKFGSIGASISVGHMTNPLTGEVKSRNLLYSWGQIIARKNGQKCLNFGFSGATATTWFTNDTYNCAEEVSKPENLCQAYLIQLGFNWDTGGLGEYADIDWGNRDNNATTFWGQYARVVQLLRDVAPDAIIFCLSLPYPRKNIEKNNIIRAISEDEHVNSHTFYVDVNKYDDVLEKYVAGTDKGEAPATFDKFYYDWHYTSVGYAEYGRVIERAVSETINNNAENPIIRSIGFIPYGSNDIIE